MTGAGEPRNDWKGQNAGHRPAQRQGV